MSRSRDLANLAGDATGLETLTVSDITDLTATATELNYVDGVSSALQTQIDAKAPTASPTFTGTTTVADFVPATPLSHRNLIINGAMQVAQRGTSFTGLTNGNEGYTLDRFKWDESGSPTAVNTVAKDTNAPADFASSLKVTVTTADTAMASADHVCIQHKIEAQNLQQLNYGSSDAKSITLSFWVKSNKTGNYGIWFYRPDADRNASYTYSISSADTWEKKTITIAGDTSGSGIDNDNGEGLLIGFGLASGTDFTGGGNSWVAGSSNRFLGQNVNIMDSTSNYWQMTGVQLELGSVATPFEYRSYGEELARCQRYYQIRPEGSDYPVIWSGDVTSGKTYYTSESFPTTMRAQPTITITSSNSDYMTSISVSNPSAYGVRTLAVASSTNARGYFQFSYTADAEL